MSAADIAIVLLAAGRSRRMGQDKLMRMLPSGQLLVENRIEMINQAGFVPYVAVPHDSDIKQLVEQSRATCVPVSTDIQGMGHSLSTAVKALPPISTGIVVVLADLPDLTAQDLTSILNAFDGQSILRATSDDGKAGHPVVFPARLRPELEALTGDNGAKQVMSSEAVQHHPLPKKNAIRDLDTPEDWRAWEKTKRKK
ncbi:nucleotidyltransferase family protein [Aliiroseovarius sp. F20344]|uniref:nucleotidyltransferase family protein n=1 Tax=Aliiroseovarius sp. F20344 TaxID=2926414 RepID=UPI001FF1E01A|nr:nucleotidyltransferase family protein [Aliiroseovarius sp. F20344]MCK0143684.1 nucleotidyltransferase family protein [Aliiroseovarius sp. F20344]